MNKIILSFLMIVVTSVAYEESLSGFQISNEYPPKHWWKDETSFKIVELRNRKLDEFLMYSSWQTECKTWVESPKSTKKIERKDCAEYIEYSKQELDEKYKHYLLNSALIHQEGWLKFKEQYKNSDVILNYSAPPLSGGFGVFILRNNTPVVFYELGVQ